jgi:hypothetical protein
MDSVNLGILGGGNNSSEMVETVAKFASSYATHTLRYVGGGPMRGCLLLAVV